MEEPSQTQFEAQTELMSKEAGYYELLGVAENVDIKTIRRVKNAKLLLLHPDKYSGDDADEKTKEINAAYEYLSNPNRRYLDEHLILEEQLFIWRFFKSIIGAVIAVFYNVIVFLCTLPTFYRTVKSNYDQAAKISDTGVSIFTLIRSYLVVSLILIVAFILYATFSPIFALFTSSKYPLLFLLNPKRVLSSILLFFDTLSRHTPVPNLVSGVKFPTDIIIGLGVTLSIVSFILVATGVFSPIALLLPLLLPLLHISVPAISTVAMSFITAGAVLVVSFILAGLEALARGLFKGIGDYSDRKRMEKYQTREPDTAKVDATLVQQNEAAVKADGGEIIDKKEEKTLEDATPQERVSDAKQGWYSLGDSYKSLYKRLAVKGQKPISFEQGYFRAACFGDVNDLELILPQVSSVSSVDMGIDKNGQPMRRTALHWAAIAGNADNMTFLVSNNIDLGARDSDNKTAYDYAKVNENEAVVGMIETLNPNR